MNPSQKQQRITLSNGQHRGNGVVWVDFAYTKNIVDQIKAFGGRWSQSKKRWYVSKAKFDLHAFFEAFKKSGFIDYSEMRSKNAIEKVPARNKKKAVEKASINLPKGYKELLDQKRYSESTKKTYINYFTDFVIHFHGKELKQITKQEINAYILELIEKGNISTSQQNQRINAIKFYYEKVLGRKKEYFDIERPRKEKTLPSVISNSSFRAKLTNKLRMFSFVIV